MVARRRAPVVPGGQPTAHYRRWWREQRVSAASMESGVAAIGRPDGPFNSGVSFSSGNQQVEQSGASSLLVHLLELAGRAIARLRDGGAPDREHDHGQGSDSHLQTGSAEVPGWPEGE